jgi:L-serine deaminase
MLGGVCGQLDPGDVEILTGFLKKKSIGATQLQKLAACAMTPDKIDAASELAPQHRLGPTVVGVSISMAAGEIIRVVVGGWIEIQHFCAAQTTRLALQDIAAVSAESKHVATGAVAGRTGARNLFGVPRCSS